MQTRKRAYAVLCLLLVGCGPTGGPGPDSGPAAAVTPLTLEPPPIYALLGYRAELELESEQVTRLDSLANWVREENARLVDSLRSAGSQAAQNRRAMVVDESTEGLLEQVRANNRRAGEAVGEVLTEEQRATVCRLYERGRRGEAARREERARERDRREPEADSTAVPLRGSRLWPWCTGTAAPADSVGAR